MPITQLPEAPNRTDGHETFVEKANAHVAALTLFTTEANALEENVNTKETNAVTAEESAVASAAMAVASANFKGGWSGLSGTAAKPYSCYHNSRYWMLLNDLADVTASEPGVTVDWAEIVVGSSLRPQSGEILTGNIHGFNASMNVGSITETDITFQAGRCWDSTGTVLLEAANSQVVTVPTAGAASVVQNYFICDDGVIRPDTDVGGTNLLAGSVSHLRWLFYNRGGSSGYRTQFLSCGDRIIFLTIADDANWLGDVTTSWASIDHSAVLPESRIAEIWYGFGGLDSCYVECRDGAVGGDGVTKRTTTWLGGGPTSYGWGHAGSMQPGHIVFNPSREFKTSSGALGVNVHGVRLKR